MDHVSYSELRQHMREHFDAVHERRAPLLVTRRSAPSMVVVDAEEWAAIQETLHLLSSPANAERLMRSIDSLEAGQGVERDPTA